MADETQRDTSKAGGEVFLVAPRGAVVWLVIQGEDYGGGAYAWDVFASEDEANDYAAGLELGPGSSAYVEPSRVN